jgi:hypothetical protein
MPILSRGWTSSRSTSSIDDVVFFAGFGSVPDRIGFRKGELPMSGMSVFDWSWTTSVFFMFESFLFMVTLFLPSTRCQGLLLVW